MNVAKAKRGNTVIVVFLSLCALALGWRGLGSTHSVADFQPVTGTVSSATGSSRDDSSDFTLRIWTEEKNGVSYRLAPKISGETVGQVHLGRGAKVEMQALTSEINEPFRGVFHNVPPSIEIATLKVDGKEASSWETYQKYETTQKIIFIVMTLVFAGLAGAALYGRRNIK